MTKINLQDKIVLITGSAGFIGANLVQALIKTFSHLTIIGIDNLNDYYDVNLKKWRLSEIDKTVEQHGNSTYAFIKCDLTDKDFVDNIFSAYKPDLVVHLAAQAGVRYSISQPDIYVQSNVIGFYNILEACRRSYANSTHGLHHLVFASSSSVYGANEKVPFSTDDLTDSPVSLYAATKKSNELFAHCYSKLYNIPSTGLRFFTVYGPGGRPDMAYFKFTNTLIRGGKIKIFNYGNCMRDFTYIDDIVNGVITVMQNSPDKKNGEDGLPVPPFGIYNIGKGQPESLLEFVDILQQELIRAQILPDEFNFEAHREFVPMQPGDVPITYADTTSLEQHFNFRPKTTLREGLRQFVTWYKEYYI